MTNKQRFALIAFLGAIIIAGFWFTRAKPEDITRCQLQTGWSADRCKHEINL